MELSDNIKPSEDPAGKLAQMAANLKFEDIPSEHAEYVKKDILDALACIIAGSMGPTVPIAIEAAKQWGSLGSCRVLVHGDKLSADAAAFINGTMARSQDMGDTHNTGGHICEWIIPTLMTGISMTDKKISGKDFITAFVAGAEWGAREHITVHLQYHTTISPGECAGPRYATGALAKLLGLNKEQIWAAEGFAYSSRPQSEQQKYNEGSPLVRLQHGYVCAYAVKAVTLAKKNVESIKGIYMGEGGLLKNIKHGDIKSPECLSEGLGQLWKWRDGITMKPYAGCKYNHTPIYGLLSMMKMHEFTYKDIEKVHFVVSSGCRCTIEPAEVKWAPQTPAEALFSNPYAVAFACMTGDCFIDAFEKDTVSERMNCKEFKELMGRFSYEVDPTITTPFDNYPIKVTLKDGRVFEKVESKLLGNTENPMSWEDLEHKFRNCVKYSALNLGEEKYKRIIELCKDLDKVEDINELLNVMVP